MRRNGVRIDQGVCITSHASQCRTGWYASLSRAQAFYARLHARQGGVTSIGDVPWRAQVSVGALPSFAKFKAAVQKSNDARSLGDALSGNRPRDWNGALDAYRHMTPLSKIKTRSRKTHSRNWALPKR
jgi:hypothetical protein